MKKIFLSVLIALSFQTIAQTSSLDMSKILEPSKEEQERRYYKDLNERLNPKLIHDENAPLVNEDECFAEAYDELKKYMERVENETNTKYRGYENQIKQLTEFTNKKARGMGYKRATFFYKMEFYDRLRAFVKREAENQERIENSIAQSKAADLKAATEYQKMEEEKKFNSNPKNFPYKENWFDYEKGIYEIKLIEITDQRQIQNIKNKYKDKLSNELCSDYFTNYEKSIEDMKEIYFYEYNFEEINGFFVNSEKVTDLVLNSPFMGQSFFKNKKYSNYKKDPNSSDIYNSVYLNANSGKMEPLIYDADGTEVKVSIDSILNLDIHNYKKKLYLSINFNQNKVPYYLSLKDKQPELYELYKKSWFSSIIVFEGYNLNENILFLKRNCNNPPNLH